MLLGRGVYSFSEAAALTQLKTARVREWFQSRPTSSLGALFLSDFADQTKQRLISFLDLVDLFVAGQLREHGISMATLRRVYGTLQDDYGVEHPFGRKELFSDGKRVFLAGLDQQGRNEVFDVLTRQKAFPKIILPFLKRLEFDPNSRLAMKWHIADGVVLNPQLCFGRPIVESCGIPTDVLANALRANHDANVVADWYGVNIEQVRLAERFEARRAA